MTPSLSPLLYVRRNPGKTLPIAFVIVLAVSLVGSIVTIVHSIDLTIFTLYGYNRYLTGITPRNALVVEPAELAKVRALPELGHLYPSHSYQTLIKTIFGKMVFPIFGLDAPARINQNFSITRHSAQILVVILLQTAFADNISGFKLFRNFRFFQLLQIDFADVAENVRQNFAVWIMTLRLNFDAQFGQFQRMCFDPRDVLRRGVFLQHD